TAVHQAFDRDFLALDVSFHLDEIARFLTHHLDLGRAQERPDALEGFHELLGIVGPSHAAAGRKSERLEHAGKPDGSNARRKNLTGVGGKRKADERRYAQARGAQALARV